VSIICYLRYLCLALLLIICSNFIPIAFPENVSNTGNNSSLTHPSNSINESKNVTIIDAVGDIECSKNIHDKILQDNPTIFIALGDLCYNRNLTNFINTYNDFKKVDKLACVIGNHESLENANLKELKQALEYCGDHWFRKIANDTTLLIGLNTNGNIRLQSNWGKSLVLNLTFMDGIKNVLLFAHKPAHSPPGPDHKVVRSSAQLFSAIVDKIPEDIEVYEIAAHNHLMAESSNGRWFISGAGGRSLYDFSTDSSWSLVNNKEFGYLQIKINNTDGNVLSTHFYGFDDGKLIH